MTWNYRVIAEKDPHGYCYYVTTVYYLKGKIKTWADSPAYPVGDSLSELRRDMKLMKKAFKKPILTVVDGKLKKF